MKALTIRQPWASLIAHGVKTIETRSWRTHYRGPIAIHAGATADLDTPRELHPGPKFQSIPETWLDEPTFLCADGHVSMTVLGTDSGDRCLGCQGRVRMTDPILQGIGDLSLGAIVATARLVDCLPIVEDDECVYLSWLTDEMLDQGGAVAISVDDEREPACRLTLWRPSANGTGCEDTFIGEQEPYGDFTPGRWAWLLDDVKPTTERCPACWGTRIVPGSGWGDDLANDAEPCPHCWVHATQFIPAGKSDPIPAKGRQGLWEFTP